MSDLEQVTFTVALPAYVFTAAAVQGILEQAKIRAAGRLDIKPAEAAEATVAPTGVRSRGTLGDTTIPASNGNRMLLPMPPGAALPDEGLHYGAAGGLSSYRGAAFHAWHPGPVAEAMSEEDSDGTSSMGASVVGDSAEENAVCCMYRAQVDGTFMGGGSELSNGALAARQNRFQMLMSDANMSDISEDPAAGDDASMASRQDQLGNGSSSDDDWGTEVRHRLQVGMAAGGIDGGGSLSTAGIDFNSTALASEGASVKAADLATVQMQWTVQMPEHELRLGSVAQEAGASDGVLTVSAALLQEDLQRMRVHLMDLLGLHCPDKDPDQFRRGPPAPAANGRGHPNMRNATLIIDHACILGYRRYFV